MSRALEAMNMPYLSSRMDRPHDLYFRAVGMYDMMPTKERWFVSIMTPYLDNALGGHGISDNEIADIVADLKMLGEFRECRAVERAVDDCWATINACSRLSEITRLWERTCPVCDKVYSTASTMKAHRGKSGH
jgi:hypothetical protein